MIAAIFFIFIQYETKLSNDVIERFGRYNFGKNGEYIFTATSEQDQDIMISMFSEDQVPILEQFEDNKKNLCYVSNSNNTAAHFVLSIRNGTGTYSDTFSKFYVIISATSKCNSTDKPVNIIANFRNSQTNLSTDVYPVLFLKPILALFYLVLLILWIIFYFVQHQKIGFIWILMTITLSFFFIDNLICFLLLFHFTKSDDSTAFTYVRYCTRAISLLLFYATIILSAFAITRDEKRIVRDHIIASFATGIFIAVPITFIEEINKTDSELWMNLLASIFLFICWGISFSMLFKTWNKIFDLFHQQKENSSEPDSLITRQYRALNMHTILYAIVLFTSICYVLLPYPMQYAFVLSQFVLDWSCFAELLVSILFSWILKMVFDIKEPSDTNCNEEIRSELLEENFHEPVSNT